jgi:hypothetical protein
VEWRVVEAAVIGRKTVVGDWGFLYAFRMFARRGFIERTAIDFAVSVRPDRG